ncbi:dephospho-CoA kinase [Pseudoflavonifractor phocaeensis]|uniref:dephospho-CoA kinase n=1 Tax=Pseudoflavonifractor phocaeensis TaxID=1870988 RepID=UPI00195E6FCC|nr:dephospho-CoA kinase [Pseudoflavonifractor phocaeensis]MBM6924758.1 dephospho-CoA kinase [Pseudoflavonifractor phocaeensis]
MKRIGITGPTGAGKTTALHALAELGAHIIDADQVYHQLLAGSVPMRRALLDRFGVSIREADGEIDRKALGAIVFADPNALSDLNAITHRFVGDEIASQSAQAEREGRPAVAIDAIALIESGIGAECDAVVGVLAPKEVRIRRIMAREGISEAYARKRVEAQQGDGFYRIHCTHILENGEGSEAEFHRRALALFQTLIP